MVGIRRTSQGGSIASFVIVGIILAFGLVGGLYYLKNYGTEARKDVAIAEYEQEKSKVDETETSPSKSGDQKEPEASDNEEIIMSEELPATGPNNFYNLFATFFLSLAFSYYLSSIYQKSRF